MNIRRFFTKAMLAYLLSAGTTSGCEPNVFSTWKGLEKKCDGSRRVERWKEGESAWTHRTDSRRDPAHRPFLANTLSMSRSFRRRNVVNPSDGDTSVQRAWNSGRIAPQPADRFEPPRSFQSCREVRSMGRSNRESESRPSRDPPRYLGRTLSTLRTSYTLRRVRPTEPSPGAAKVDYCQIGQG